MEYLDFYFLSSLLFKYQKQLTDDYKMNFQYTPSTTNYNKDEFILSFNNTFSFKTNSFQWNTYRCFVITENKNNMLHSYEYKLTPVTNVPIKVVNYNKAAGIDPSIELENFYTKVMEIFTKLQNSVIQEKLSFVG